MVYLLVAIGAGLALLSHTAPFPFLLDVIAGKRAVWRVKPSGGPPTVYLTFDDGPNPTATPALLDVLAREQARATFFLIDRHLTADTAPIVRRIVGEGHAVALHSHTRRLMIKTPADLAATLRAAADRIEQVTGQPPCPFFRPHAGWRSGAMYAGLAKLEYRLAGWGFGLWDWNWFRRRSAGAIAGRIGSRAAAGDIIVLHDGHHVNPRADRHYTVEATAKLVPALRARGFRFGTLCDLGAL